MKNDDYWAERRIQKIALEEAAISRIAINLGELGFKRKGKALWRLAANGNTQRVHFQSTKRPDSAQLCPTIGVTSERLAAVLVAKKLAQRSEMHSAMFLAFIRPGQVGHRDTFFHIQDENRIDDAVLEVVTLLREFGVAWLDAHSADEVLIQDLLSIKNPIHNAWGRILSDLVLGKEVDFTELGDIQL